MFIVGKNLRRQQFQSNLPHCESFQSSPGCKAVLGSGSMLWRCRTCWVLNRKRTNKEHTTGKGENGGPLRSVEKSSKLSSGLHQKDWNCGGWFHPCCTDCFWKARCSNFRLFALTWDAGPRGWAAILGARRTAARAFLSSFWWELG